jgi:threonine/homoserine/homoserine lactone efflux protein
LGLGIQVVAVSFGLGTIVERSAAVFTTVKLLGAVYLVYLGIQAVRHRSSLAEAVAIGMSPVPPRRALRDGVIVGITNPKTIAFFVIALPEFAGRGPGSVTPQFLILGSLFPLIALLLDSIWAVAAGAAGQWLARSPRRLAAIGGAGGVAMIGLGLSVAGHRTQGLNLAGQ